MASDIDFLNYVVEQIRNAGNITWKKMFGEYLIYANGKPVVLVCDNTAFVKIHDCVKPYLETTDKGFPYDGAKEHYIVDVDNSELLSTLVQELEKVIPVPKPRKKKT
ncbi:competence protein TfoX [Spirochaetia bacterium]|nr:competence protein TfoX [Spirochaetia bacterium]GHV73422.1 competence protein TfoX [Spirochaetia bacterium]GHV78917.1 competence protein TfoX [Spirochaetia bacterium]